MIDLDAEPVYCIQGPELEGELPIHYIQDRDEHYIQQLNLNYMYVQEPELHETYVHEQELYGNGQVVCYIRGPVIDYEIHYISTDLEDVDYIEKEGDAEYPQIIDSKYISQEAVNSYNNNGYYEVGI